MEEVKEGEAVQQVIAPEDFVANNDEAERRAFELVRRLSEVEAEALWQRGAMEARVDVAVVHEYEQWQAKAATRRIKKEIIDLDDE
jgi:hypothetical protein